jgi:hypothetical protein
VHDRLRNPVTASGSRRRTASSSRSANGNAIHEAAKLVLDPRKIMSAADIAKCITAKASNLPWRVSGTKSWSPRSYVKLFLDGTDGDDDVLAEIRRTMPDIDHPAK